MSPDGPLMSQWQKIDGCCESYGWEANVRNWKCFQTALTNKRHESLNLLSEAQQSSMKLLEHWWPSDEAAECRRYIYNPGNHPIPKNAGSAYKRTMFDLWLAEFGLYESERFKRYQEFDSLATIRRTAAAVAATYQLSLASLAIAGLRQENGSVFSHHASHHGQAKPVAASISPCPWLEKQERAAGMPYYLWDRELCKTVRCPPDAPNYIAISHTWGRWEVKGSKIDVPGTLWKIPSVRHEILDVEQLPDILAHIPLATRYVWLDLVCIPQDDDNPIKRVEVARQVAIFTSASSAVAWFHQLESWDGVLAAVRWMSARYLTRHEGYAFSDTTLGQLDQSAEQTSHLAQRLEEGLDSTMKLFFHDRAPPYRRNVLPDGWFTSLWTLQEACLKPDMYLCTNHWEILRLDTDLSITLDRLVAIFNLAFESHPLDTELPLSVHELAGILTNTAMHKLLDMTPIDVLCFGNQRYCETKDRGIATMSVLGSTEWHRSYDGASNKILLLDRYPINFVREVRRKFGAAFFLSVIFTRYSEDNYRISKRSGKITDTRIRGSMLPFTDDARFQQAAVMVQLQVKDHPVVDHWTIQSSGQVTVSEASILASWPPQTRHQPKVSATVTALVPGDRLSGKVVLNEWLGSWAKKSEKHAICLLIDEALTQFGVLLERVYLYRGQKHFMKVGVFYTTTAGSAFPPTQRVNWNII